MRAVGVRRGQRPPERGARAARPEEQPDEEAHRAAERDVFDPQQPDTPSGRLDDVEQDHDRQRERGLSCGERDRRRGEAGEQDGRRKQEPQHRGVRADDREQRRRDDEAGRRAEHGPQDVLTGGERVRPQHGQGAEHDPERVLHAGAVGHEHGQAQTDRAADAVVQPDRVPVEVGGRALLRGRDRSGDACRLAAEEPVQPAAPLGGRGQVDVRRDLGDDEPQLLRAEARVEGGDHHRVGEIAVDGRDPVRCRSRSRPPGREARPPRRAGRRESRPGRREGPRRARASRPPLASPRRLRGSRESRPIARATGRRSRSAS